MSGQWLRAQGSAPSIEAASPGLTAARDKTKVGKQPSARFPKIAANIAAFLNQHSAECNWWWRDNNIHMFGTVDMKSFLFRQIFNESAYWYELHARRLWAPTQVQPDYHFGRPFNLLTFAQAWDVWKKVDRLNRQGLHVAPLDWAEQLSGSLPGKQFVLHIDLENFKDGALQTQFEKCLKRLREESEIAEPKKGSRRANRILNDGRSFSAIEALDVRRLSQDGTLKKCYSDDVTKAQRDIKKIPNGF